MSESALAIDVPKAESYVSDLRNQYDPSAALGAPAHITLIYPFIPPEAISEQDVERIVHILSLTHSFYFVLNRVGRFVETTFLLPDPEQPFIELIQLIESEFPLYPPYGGIHKDIKPHLTVANGNKKNAVIAERALNQSLKAQGEIECVCSQVLLLENSTDQWRRKNVFNLADIGGQ